MQKESQSRIYARRSIFKEQQLTNTSSEPTVLAKNNKYLLFSKENSLQLLDSKTLKVRYSKETPYQFRVGCMQYGTGIVAVSKGSLIHIYDIKYHRETDKIQTYQKIMKLYMLKNMLIYISEERIIIHDLVQKQNVSYIPIKLGSLAFLDTNYHNIQMYYHVSDQVIINKSLWRNTSFKINQIIYQKGTYISQGKIVCLINQNVLSMYQDDQLIRVISFQYLIKQFTADADTLFVKLGENNQVFRVKEKDNKMLIQFTEQIQVSESNHQLWVSDKKLYSWQGDRLKIVSFQQINTQEEDNGVQKQSHIPSVSQETEFNPQNKQNQEVQNQGRAEQQNPNDNTQAD